MVLIVATAALLTVPSSPEVDDISKVNYESAPIPVTNDFGLMFLGGPLLLMFYEFFFVTKNSCLSVCHLVNTYL